MSLGRVVGVSVVAALVGCRDPEPPPTARRVAARDAAVRREPPPPTVPALAPPPPDAVPVGWDLVPVDDGNGGVDTTWLVLSARPSSPSPPRELLNVGPRGRCSELDPHVLRPRAGARGAPIRALLTVRCELPERGDFSLAQTSPGRWEVLRSGCADGFYPCPAGAAPDEIVARAPVDTAGLRGLAPGPVARREARPPMPPASGDAGAPAGAVTLSWRRGPRMDPLIPGTSASDNLALVLRGAVERRLDLGPMGECSVPERPEPRVSPRASLLRLSCVGAGRGTRVWSVTRDGDALRVYLTIVDARGGVTEPMRVTQRVELPAGAVIAR